MSAAYSCNKMRCRLLALCSCSDLPVSVNVDRLTSAIPRDTIHRSPWLEWCGKEAVLQRGFGQDASDFLHFKSLKELRVRSRQQLLHVPRAGTQTSYSNLDVLVVVWGKALEWSLMPLLNLRAATMQSYLCVSRELYVQPLILPLLIVVNVSWLMAAYYDYRSVGGDLLWYPRKVGTTFPACEMNWTKVRRKKGWHEYPTSLALDMNW